ncbi:30S ribosomal protein S13 [Thermoproteota archaeon]
MAEGQRDFKHIVRVANTDLDGSKKISHALLKIKGVGFVMSNALCMFAKVNGGKKAGVLSSDEVQRLEKVLKHPIASGIPIWMLNRRKDYETGEDIHLLGADLKYQKDNDIKILRKIKSYKGMRHSWGLPVRGQSTKSNFRK